MQSCKVNDPRNQTFRKEHKDYKKVLASKAEGGNKMQEEKQLKQLCVSVMLNYDAYLRTLKVCLKEMMRFLVCLTLPFLSKA